MEYRCLGDTDITVSLIALGTMTFGEQNTQAEAFTLMDAALAEGVTLLDVAELYPVPPNADTFGQSEIIVGNWLAARGMRERVVLASKVAGNSARGPRSGHIRNGSRLSAAQIQQALEGSLTRLQTDYLDLYQLHWPDRNTNCFGRASYQHDEDEDAISLEESLSALKTLIQAGKIRTYGLSNETPWGLMDACRAADKLGMPRPVSVQNPYNLLNRMYETGMAEMSIREDMGLLAYSPLAFGLLSGKYCGGARPERARLTLFPYFSRYQKTYVDAAVQAYVDLAEAHQLDPAAMALAFVNQQRFVTATIIGATTMEQLQQNMRSVSLVLQPEVLSGIQTIHHQYGNPAP